MHLIAAFVRYVRISFIAHEECKMTRTRISTRLGSHSDYSSIMGIDGSDLPYQNSRLTVRSKSVGVSLPFE